MKTFEDYSITLSQDGTHRAIKLMSRIINKLSCTHTFIFKYSDKDSSVTLNGKPIFYYGDDDKDNVFRTSSKKAVIETRDFKRFTYMPFNRQSLAEVDIVDLEFIKNL